jgi:hypothetical protein
MRWKPALNAFAITSSDRFPAAETYSPIPELLACTHRRSGQLIGISAGAYQSVDPILVEALRRSANKKVAREESATWSSNMSSSRSSR